MLLRPSLFRLLGRGLAILAISGLFGAALVRLAPGFGIDERALDTRFSARIWEACSGVMRGSPWYSVSQ